MIRTMTLALGLVPALVLGQARRSAAAETLTRLPRIPMSTSTGEKPQSKLWFHADHWWAVLPSTSVSPSGTWLWRLEPNDTWKPVARIAGGTTTKADAKSFGDVVHVLLHAGSATQLVSLEYSTALDSYVPWSERPTPTPINLSGSETATIDVDTTGELWLSTENGSHINEYWSAYPYTSFSGPFAVDTHVEADDISVVVALPLPLPSKIGVFWSNQNTKLDGFRWHKDGDPPTQWSADEKPAAKGALNAGTGFADDHMNAAVGSDGTLYMAIKTSYNTPTLPLVGLLVRHPNGTWDPLYEVERGTGTRGVALLNEQRGIVRVVYTASSGGGSIYYRDSPLKPIKFGARKTLLSGNLNDATSTKDNWTDSLVVIASGQSAIFRDTGVSTSVSSTSTSSTSTTTKTTLAGPSVTSTSTSTTSTMPSATTATAFVVADVSVVAGSATRYGTATKLEVDNSPVKHAYLQFSVSGIGSHGVAMAALKLKVASTTGADSVTRGRVHKAACGWSEATLSGTTSPQPAIDATVLDAPAGNATMGTVISYDVTKAITGDGTYCFALDSLATDGVDFVSREATTGGPVLAISLKP